MLCRFAPPFATDRPRPGPRSDEPPTMASKRASAAKAASSTSSASASTTSPAVNAVMLGSAMAFGLYMLVARGRMSWPPTDLLSNAFTLAGCVALVGPIVLFRRDSSEGGVGDMLWMTGGVLIWIFNAAALLRSDLHAASLATPIAARTMGLTILAVLLATLRLKGGSRSWSWTNVTGWVLGLFWVGLALVTLWPNSPVRLASR